MNYIEGIKRLMIVLRVISALHNSYRQELSGREERKKNNHKVAMTIFKDLLYLFVFLLNLARQCLIKELCDSSKAVFDFVVWWCLDIL